jgi:competence CoiA-like predicted nuclease
MATEFLDHQQIGATRAFPKYMMHPHSMAIEKFQLAQKKAIEKNSVIIMLATEKFWSSQGLATKKNWLV